MKRFVPYALLICGLAVAAWAGSRAKETSGARPTLSTDGVSLSEVEGCRASVRSTDGGTVNGGKLVLFYYDAVLGWTRAQSSLDCTLEANKMLDGGAPSAQVCPDYGTLARFGRVGVASQNLVSADGGTVAGATVRLECWGRNLP